MAKDIIYTFDKKTYNGSLFGEIQSNFNMSLTIDGTRDSMKVNVWSFIGNEIEPYTVVYHKNTQTWWIVSNDKVERYTNEDGFIYLHNLQLTEAVELLNARDLTDCGFNANTYTISEFTRRLFKLSNFIFTDNNDLTLDINTKIANKKVEHIKTFENYTLLSALREFFNDYNMNVSLSFVADFEDEDEPYIYGATLTSIQRTGNFNLYKSNINDFDDVRETKTISKDSFGTTVVSNAENVVSSVPKTFPSLGTVRASGTEYNILAQNAIIRLPSNVFKANWIKLCKKIPNISVSIKIGSYNGIVYNGEFGVVPFSLNPYNMTTVNNCFEYLDSVVYTVSQQQSIPSFYNNYISIRSAKKDEIINYFKKGATITLYNGNELNPVTGEIVKGADVPYIPSVIYNAKFISGQHPFLPLIFCDKEMRDMMQRPWQAICWERGKNTISCFNAFETEQGGQGSITAWNIDNCDLQGQSSYMIYDDGNGNYVRLDFYASGDVVHFRDMQWIVNYIPMTDIKLKIDNDRESRDIQLYNQNGRLTDSIALSKTLNSYSKEISSNTITRYKTYYKFFNPSSGGVPSIGSVVLNGDEYYVINNLSLDFFPNENDGYYIEAEITMSKYTTVKSIMVNPNTNIRDYGIPQSNNVKRKQVYRDYFELDYEPNGISGYYLSPSHIFDFYSNEPKELTAVMRLHYARPINNSYYYYYQLDTVNYYMNKLWIVVCDFNDNNIIGYTNQNVWSGFDISRVFQGQIDSLNTPISYTDAKGQVQDIDVCFETNEQLTNIYYDYQMSQTGGDTYTGTLYNYSPFIPKAIYDGAYTTHAIRINELGYDKDALEVPVFEYSCQIGDNENVLIGDNILSKHENTVIFYSFYTDNNLTQETATTNIHITKNGDVLSINNAAWVQYESAMPSPALTYNHINIYLYANRQYNIDDGTVSSGTILDIPNYNIDIAIFRHCYNLDTNEETVELAFIVKNVTNDKLYSRTRLVLAVNYYKVK